MIRVTIVPKHLKKIAFEHVYTLKTRQTYLGVSREVLRPDLEVGCTKTAILGFVKQRDAQRFRELVIQQQQKRRVLDRQLHDNGYLDFVSQEQQNSSLNPIELESIPRLFLLYMCILQAMDVYIVDDFSKSLGPYPTQWKMYCYETRFDHLPNPDVLTQLL